MTRDISERLAIFMAQDLGLCGEPGAVYRKEDAWVAEQDLGEDFLLERIALNMDQIRRYNPPPNPAKLGDSRSTSYIEQFGDRSWELDALGPRILVPMIEKAILKYLDVDMFNARVREQRKKREILALARERWDDVKEFLTA